MNADRFKFRIWSGEQMVSPDYLTRDGYGHWKENSIPTSSSKLMQCTGLKDVEGKLIFESDIVQYERGLPDPVTGLLEVITCTIEWRNGRFYIPTFDFNLKIIGNIYETVQE